MIENTNKTIKFLQTPKVIVDLMHAYLQLKESDSLLDLTAGRGNLFASHHTSNCFGCEIDSSNCSFLKEKGFKNIICGDVFEVAEKIKDESMDAVVLNPPFGKLRNKKNSVDIMNLAIKKLKVGGKFAIINSKSYPIVFTKSLEYFKKNTAIEYAAIFGNNLFQPFANTQTLLVCGVKGTTQKANCKIEIFNDDKILVNKRAKVVECVLLEPEKHTIQIDFWNSIYLNNQQVKEPPNLDDFKKTVIDFMSFESGIPKDFFHKPELFGKMINYITNKSSKYTKTDQHPGK